VKSTTIAETKRTELQLAVARTELLFGISFLRLNSDDVHDQKR
jgi:hypothetical protein